MIEDEEELDIQNIQEIDIKGFKGYVQLCNYLEAKGNEIIKAIKQIDIEIKELVKCQD